MQPDVACYTHIGWVPCLTGHLDFELIFPGLRGDFPSNGSKDKHFTRAVFNSSIEDLDSYRIKAIIESWVDWKDVLEGDGVSRMLLIADSTETSAIEQRALQGTIIYYQKALEKSEIVISEQLQKMFQKLKEIRKQQNSYILNKQKHNHEELKKNIKNLTDIFDEIKDIGITQIPNVIQNQSLKVPYHTIDFRVEADGLAYLKFNNRYKHAHITDKTKFVAIRQSYYYIKYSLHKHAHHTYESDALTTVIENNTKQSNDSSEIGYRLINQIKRELTLVKRAQKISKEFDKSDPLGILSYLSSLVLTLKNRNLISNDDFDKERQRASAIEKSFLAQEKQRSRIQLRKNQIFTASLQVTSIFVAVSALSIVLIARFSSGSNEVLLHKYNSYLLESLAGSNVILNLVVFLLVTIIIFILVIFLFLLSQNKALLFDKFTSKIIKFYNMTDNAAIGLILFYVLFGVSVVALFLYSYISKFY